MKKYFAIAVVAGSLFTNVLCAQKSISVPEAVKTSFSKKYPSATHVIWEKENGNYEANWGGKSNEDNSAIFAPSGTFIEIAKAISVKELPASATTYIKSHYKNAAVNEAAIVTDANGKVTYEAEVNNSDVVFDNKGNFVKTKKE